MTCQQIEQLKEAYVDGRLAPTIATAIEAHAATCSTCRQRLALARQVAGGLGAATKTLLGRPTLSAARGQALEDRLARRRPARWAPGLRYSTVAAMFLILLVMGTTAVSMVELGNINLNSLWPQ